jgi:hypothetical protein
LPNSIGKLIGMEFNFRYHSHPRMKIYFLKYKLKSLQHGQNIGKKIQSSEKNDYDLEVHKIDVPRNEFNGKLN